MNRWGILAVLFTVRAVMGFQFQSIASVSNFLVPDLTTLHFSHNPLPKLNLM